jgi:Phage integrase family
MRGQAIRSGDPACFGSWASRCGDPWPAMERHQGRADHGAAFARQDDERSRRAEAQQVTHGSDVEAPRGVSRVVPRRSLWVVSELDGSCVTYDRMLETVHAIYVRAGVARPPKALHCLRHTFGTVMARKVPLPVLQKLMGHSDVQTTLRYVDVNEDDMRSLRSSVLPSPSCKPGASERTLVNQIQL